MTTSNMSGYYDEFTFEWERFGEGFVADLWRFYDSNEYSDVTIVAENDTKIKSHRILLAMCSTYFREMFKRNRRTGNGQIVRLVHIRSEILQKIFKLIYGGVIKIPRIDVRAFIKAAKFLKLHGFENIDDIGGVEQQGDPEFKFTIRLNRMNSSSLDRSNVMNQTDIVNETPGMIQTVSSSAKLATKLAEGTQRTDMITSGNDIKKEKFFPSDESSDEWLDEAEMDGMGHNDSISNKIIKQEILN